MQRPKIPVPLSMPVALLSSPQRTENFSVELAKAVEFSSCKSYQFNKMLGLLVISHAYPCEQFCKTLLVSVSEERNLSTAVCFWYMTGSLPQSISLYTQTFTVFRSLFCVVWVMCEFSSLRRTDMFSEISCFEHWAFL